MKRFLLRFSILTTVCFFIITGLFVSFAVSKDRYAELQLFTKVLNLVEQHYVEEVDTKKLIYGGIRGMLATLEPHTNFLSPEIFKEFKVETSGEYAGVGIEITVQNELLTVISPIEDTPAHAAGIKAGDRLVEIDGQNTKGMSVSEAVAKMRGKKGQAVTLGVWREGLEKPLKVSLKREIIKVRSVKSSDLNDGFLYVRITSFIDHTAENMRDALAKYEKENGKIKGVILDLRNNAGGLLDQAIQIVNLFVNDGVIVSTMGRNKKEKEVVHAKKSGARLDFPMAVLINEYSASASEIVAGALQDHKRAILMGARSFGKGSVQSVIDLGDGAGLKMTVARYYTPSGRSIQAQGIEPDVKLDNVDPDVFEKAVIKRKIFRESDMEGHLDNENEVAEATVRGAADLSDPFWKNGGKESDAEKLTKKKQEEDSKLSPSEKLVKKDYQVSQALNYLRSWSLFKDYVAHPFVSKAEAEEPEAQQADVSPAPIEAKKPAKPKAKPGKPTAPPASKPSTPAKGI